MADPEQAGELNWKQDMARLLAHAGAVPRWQLWSMVPNDHPMPRRYAPGVDKHLSGRHVDTRSVGKDRGSSKGGSAAHKLRKTLQWLEKRGWISRDRDVVHALDAPALLAWDGHCRRDPASEART